MTRKPKEFQFIVLVALRVPGGSGEAQWVDTRVCGELALLCGGNDYPFREHEELRNKRHMLIDEVELCFVPAPIF